MKFTKFNNPSKRRKKYYNKKHSKSFLNDRRAERDRLLLDCNTVDERNLILKAFDEWVYDYHK